MKLIIIMSVLMLLSFMAVNVSYVMSHERIHVAINEMYGLDSTVEYGPLMLSGTTKTAGNISQANLEVLNSYHIMNEIIGYNAWIIAGCILISVILVISYLEMRRIGS